MLGHIHRCTSRFCLKQLQIQCNALTETGVATKHKPPSNILRKRISIYATLNSLQAEESTVPVEELTDDAEVTALEDTKTDSEAPPDIMSLFKFEIAKPVTKLDIKKRNRSANPYPDDVNEKDPVLREEIKKYHRGKRWLANIMGQDADTFSQDDIDRAIKYLLPSHLSQPDARPQMKHPYEVFPGAGAKKLLDEYNRPKHPAFYLKRTAIHDLNFQIWGHLERLDALEEEEIKRLRGKGFEPEGVKKVKDEEVEWSSKVTIEHILQEKMTTQEYRNITFRLSRILTHKFLDQEASKFVKKFGGGVGGVETRRSTGRNIQGVIVYENHARALGHRKSAVADVTLYRGDGTSTVNNKPLLEYFSMYTGLEQIMHPFLITDTFRKFHFEAQVIDGGITGQAGAVRLAVSRALAALEREHFNTLYEAGLLRIDKRRVERQKPGRRGARRAFQWVRR